MVNSHQQFASYNAATKLTDDKRQTLIRFRDSLRSRMILNFNMIPAEERRNLELHFQSQGSFVMDTIIKPMVEDFDLDDGVYFQGTQSRQDRPTPTTFHNWVIKAIDKDNDYEEVKDKTTCVRVRYKMGFHIDIPIYYADNFQSPDLAETQKNWMLSNPVEFIAWFEEKTKSGFQTDFIYNSAKFAEPYEKWLTDIRKNDCQLRRLVRYLKAWADLNKKDMPCGIIMTILVANNYKTNERDDISLRDTLVAIKNYLDANEFQCPRPTSPIGEDLFAATSLASKNHFKSELKKFIDTANAAINSVTIYEACRLWATHLGPRFPVPAPLQPKVQERREPNIESLRRTAAQSTPWSPSH